MYRMPRAPFNRALASLAADYSQPEFSFLLACAAVRESCCHTSRRPA
jgi:hypothetical protein